MTTPGRLSRLLTLLAALCAPAAAIAQPAVQSHGNFKQLAHTGDASAKVVLRDLPSAKGAYAVGALAGLRGEVMMVDGRLLVSRGHSQDGRTEAPAADDAATLLALSRVEAWHEVPVPADMKQAELEAFVLREAVRRGLAADAAFPFLLRGRFAQLTWHVITGPAAGGHGGHGGAHAPAHASNRVFEERDAQGIVVGFHSGRALEGVITHPGERFHLHYATGDLSRAGHVDDYTVRAGSVLSLPAR